jgi:endonuclease G
VGKARLWPARSGVYGTNDFQPAAFLPDGAAARVVLQTPQLSISGTGFPISQELFITNQHVIADPAASNLDSESEDRGVVR